MSMELKCNSMGALCALGTFEINGIQADEEDFGEHYDTNPELAEDYCCYNMKFFSKPATQEVLDKYGITLQEYHEVCDKLDEELSFGNCGWCE